MKPLAICFLSVISYVFVAGAALAQSTRDKPLETAPPAATIANAAKHARETDARHCLGQKDDNAIIRCAERYRYRASAGSSGGGYIPPDRDSK